MMRSLIFLLAIAAVGGGGAAWYLHEQGDQSTSFRTVPAERGDLQATISSSAVIEPEEVVDIGAQVAGMIKSFGTDPRDPSKPVDYGTPVEVGTVLAKIDDAIYLTQVHQSEASLENSNAQLEQAKTKYELSKLNWDRAQELRKNNVMTQADYDAAHADLQTTKPAVDAAKAAVDQAKANLEQAQTNLAYCTIKAPVKGIIVDRRVNVGQTVVASLNAPSLFLIAKDLNRLQLWASVNEADIGQIHPDQKAKFTVDAYPRKTFQGIVTQIRLNATMTQNVVTYTVVINTDNSNGLLLPYLTANVQFEIAHRENALLVPTAALRWKPQPAQVVADAREDFIQATRRREAAKGEQGGGKKRDGSRREGPTVWVEDDGFVRPIHVQTGLTDGTRQEIVSGELKEGTQVVIGEQRHEAGTTTKNPFMPTFFRGTARGQKGQQ